MKIRTMTVCAAFAMALKMACAGLAGSYESCQDSRYVLTLTENGASKAEGAGYSESGRWKRQRIGRKDCVVITTVMRGLVEVYGIQDDGQSLRLLGRGDSLEEIEEDWREGYLPKVTQINAQLRRLAGPDKTKAAEVDGSTRSQERVREEYVEKPKRVAEMRKEIERLRKDKAAILSMPLDYPKEKPKSVVMPAEGYSERMAALGSALVLSEETFTEAELVGFLEKCDWSRGAYFVSCAFCRDELSSETRTRYAERLEAWLGTPDEVYLVGFLTHPKTPLAVAKRFDCDRLKRKEVKEELERRIRKESK